MIDSDCDSDSDSWLVATTPGDSDSDSDSAPLFMMLKHVIARLQQESFGRQRVRYRKASSSRAAETESMPELESAEVDRFAQSLSRSWSRQHYADPYSGPGLPTDI